MSILDLGIILVILVSMLIGMVRGFLREVVSLTAWILALWAAYRFAGLGAEYFAAYIDQPALRVAAAFAVVFVVGLIFASFLGLLVCRVLFLSGLGVVDRPLGLLFGVGRGVIVVAILLLTGTFMDMVTQPWWQESLLRGHFTPITDTLRAMMPPDLAANFEPREKLN